jgi:hypothetical protein
MEHLRPRTSPIIPPDRPSLLLSILRPYPDIHGARLHVAYIEINFNPDGTARARVVDSDTDTAPEGFDWEGLSLRTEDGYSVSLETRDGTASEKVTTVPAEDSGGARDALIAALMERATQAGLRITELRTPEDRQEPGS